MIDNRDPAITALIVELAESAPDAPPYPVAPRERRSVRPAAALVAAVAALVLIGGAIWLTRATDRESGPIDQPTTTQTIPPTTVVGEQPAPIVLPPAGETTPVDSPVGDWVWTPIDVWVDEAPRLPEVFFGGVFYSGDLESDDGLAWEPMSGLPSAAEESFTLAAVGSDLYAVAGGLEETLWRLETGAWVEIPVPGQGGGPRISVDYGTIQATLTLPGAQPGHSEALAAPFGLVDGEPVEPFYDEVMTGPSVIEVRHHLYDEESPSSDLVLGYIDVLISPDEGSVLFQVRETGVVALEVDVPEGIDADSYRRALLDGGGPALGNQAGIAVGIAVLGEDGRFRVLDPPWDVTGFEPESFAWVLPLGDAYLALVRLVPEEGPSESTVWWSSDLQSWGAVDLGGAGWFLGGDSAGGLAIVTLVPEGEGPAEAWATFDGQEWWPVDVLGEYGLGGLYQTSFGWVVTQHCGWGCNSSPMFSTDGVVWSPIAMPSDFSAAVAGNGADIRFFGDMGFAYVCQPEQTTCSRWTVTLDG